MTQKGGQIAAPNKLSGSRVNQFTGWYMKQAEGLLVLVADAIERAYEQYQKNRVGTSRKFSP